MAGLCLLDKPLAAKIYQRVNGYLAQDPIGLGKLLTADFSGLYRYRYSAYRIVYRVCREEITITIVTVDHRRKVYQ